MSEASHVNIDKAWVVRHRINGAWWSFVLHSYQPLILHECNLLLKIEVVTKSKSVDSFVTIAVCAGSVGSCIVVVCHIDIY